MKHIKTFSKLNEMNESKYQYIHDGGVNEAEENETPIYEELEEHSCEYCRRDST